MTNACKFKSMYFLFTITHDTKQFSHCGPLQLHYCKLWHVRLYVVVISRSKTNRMKKHQSLSNQRIQTKQKHASKMTQHIFTWYTCYHCRTVKIKSAPYCPWVFGPPETIGKPLTTLARTHRMTSFAEPVSPVPRFRKRAQPSVLDKNLYLHLSVCVCAFLSSLNTTNETVENSYRVDLGTFNHFCTEWILDFLLSLLLIPFQTHRKISTGLRYFDSRLLLSLLGQFFVGSQKLVFTAI